MTNKPTNVPNPEEEAPKKQIKKGANDLFSGIKDFFHDLIDLREGLDRYGTIRRIKENKRMRGANAWTLMCSIMIASLGLDLDSAAVIIGAMLISPLMAPILGIGLAVGINDKQALYIAARHFMIAMAIALFTSTLYFLLTPFGDFTPQIAARTKPTLLDAMVAFFGGLAGIISGTRKDISNAVPGVAIATALMPPLCVTGFGIAHMMQYGVEANGLNYWSITTNSFYLFFLNSTIIAIATYLIIRLLRFPYKEYESEKERRRTRFLLVVVSSLLIAPSIYILNGVLEEVQEEKQVELYRTQVDHFVETHFPNSLHECDNSLQDSFHIKIYSFEEIDSIAQVAYQTKLRDQYAMPNAKLLFIQNDSRGILDKMKQNKEAFNQKDQKISILENVVDSLINRIELGKEVALDKIALEKDIEAELKILFPNLATADYYPADTTLSYDNLPLLLLSWKTNRKNHKKEEDKIYKFVSYVANLDTLAIGRR